MNLINIYIAHSYCQVALDFVKAGTGLSAIWALDWKSLGRPWFRLGHAEPAQIDQHLGFEQLFGRHRQGAACRIAALRLIR